MSYLGKSQRLPDLIHSKWSFRSRSTLLITKMFAQNTQEQLIGTEAIQFFLIYMDLKPVYVTLKSCYKCIKSIHYTCIQILNYQWKLIIWWKNKKKRKKKQVKRDQGPSQCELKWDSYMGSLCLARNGMQQYMIINFIPKVLSAEFNPKERYRSNLLGDSIKTLLSPRTKRN